MESPVKALLISTLAWRLRQIAHAFEERDALAELWISDKNNTGVSAGRYRRCWPYHLAMKPFYHLAPQIGIERASYALFPIWRRWMRRQRFPEFNVVHAMMGYATEAFDVAERWGALKVIDCPNSHPTSYYGYWQRECDIWCPGERVPIPQWMFARMNRELRRADVILVGSTFVRQSMVENGLPEGKVFLNSAGVDTALFQPRTVVPTRPRFITVGTICLRKGCQYLFRAFELLRRRLPDAELVVVGDYKRDFRRERPRWEGSFTHIPWLDHPRLAAELQKATAFVAPSQEEGFAKTVIEAMAAGVPIIASHESGATTLVRDGVEGLIIPGQSPEKIAGAMERLALDRKLNESMGRAAHQKGSVSNSWQDYGDRLLAEYARRLGERRGADFTES